MLDGDPDLGKHRAVDIGKAVFTKYPVLKSWGEPLNDRTYRWADLMWLESEVMFSTMLELMQQHSTPSLSVHDSLIVPVSKAGVASETLKRRFQEQQKVEPRLKAKGPTQEGPLEENQTKEGEQEALAAMEGGVDG
jgi:hypothetical protein